MLQKTLKDVTDSLALQGFSLEAEQSPEGKVAVTIKAGPNACLECLTSKAVLHRIITADLDKDGVTYSHVSIKMP